MLQIQAATVAELFKGQPWYVLLMALLIIAGAFVIWKISPSYFDTNRMQKEIDNLQTQLTEEKSRYDLLLARMDEMRDLHKTEIQALNDKLLELSQSVMTIKSEYGNKV